MRMAQLSFAVKHQIINRLDDFVPVAKSKNYLKAQFTFLTDEWTGVITTIFSRGDTSYNVILDENNECFVPWELLMNSGDIYVSCFCDDLVTATKSRITVVETGYVDDGENVDPPTPNIYDQIITYFNAFKTTLLEDVEDFKSSVLQFEEDISADNETFKQDITATIDQFEQSVNTEIEQFEEELTASMTEYQETLTASMEEFKTNLLEDLAVIDGGTFDDWED